MEDEIRLYYGASGAVVTRPVQIADALRVTADARGGSIAVQAIDAQGKPLAEK